MAKSSQSIALDWSWVPDSLGDPISTYQLRNLIVHHLRENEGTRTFEGWVLVQDRLILTGYEQIPRETKIIFRPKSRR